MPENRISKLRNKLASALSSKKEFIPPLSMFDMASGVPLTTYETKPQQLQTNIGWVRAANRAIATPTASVPLKLRRLKKNGDFEEITEHDILTLLGDPHIAFNGKKLRELNHTYLNLTGETFMLMRKTGEAFEMKDGVKVLPDALELLPSHLVQFKLGKQRFSDSLVKYGQSEYKITEIIRGYNRLLGHPVG